MNGSDISSKRAEDEGEYLWGKAVVTEHTKKCFEVKSNKARGNVI